MLIRYRRKTKLEIRKSKVEIRKNTENAFGTPAGIRTIEFRIPNFEFRTSLLAQAEEELDMEFLLE